MTILVKTKTNSVEIKDFTDFRKWLIDFIQAPSAIQRAINLMSEENLIKAARKHSKLTKDFKFWIYKGRKTDEIQTNK